MLASAVGLHLRERRAYVRPIISQIPFKKQTYLHSKFGDSVGDKLNSTRSPSNDRHPWAATSRSRSEAENCSDWLLLSADVWNWQRNSSFVSERGDSWLVTALTAKHLTSTSLRNCSWLCSMSIHVVAVPAVVLNALQWQTVHTYTSSHTPLFRHIGSTTASHNHRNSKHTTEIYTQGTIKNTTKTYKKIVLAESFNVHKVQGVGLHTCTLNIFVEWCTSAWTSDNHFIFKTQDIKGYVLFTTITDTKGSTFGLLGALAVTHPATLLSPIHCHIIIIFIIFFAVGSIDP